jgi:hypothetical protein
VFIFVVFLQVSYLQFCLSVSFAIKHLFKFVPLRPVHMGFIGACIDFRKRKLQIVLFTGVPSDLLTSAVMNSFVLVNSCSHNTSAHQ